MAEPLEQDLRPRVRLEPRQRHLIARIVPVAAVALPLIVVILVTSRGNPLRGVVFTVALIVQPIWGTWWWRRQALPWELRGELLLPAAKWWQDRRAVLTFGDDHLRIRRAFQPESWNVPWAAIDEVVVEEGRACRLTLVLDGEPLAEMRMATDSDALVARLHACGLPQDPPT